MRAASAWTAAPGARRRPRSSAASPPRPSRTTARRRRRAAHRRSGRSPARRLLHEVAAGTRIVQGVERRTMPSSSQPEADATHAGLVGHDRLQHLDHGRRSGPARPGPPDGCCRPGGPGWRSPATPECLALVLTTGNGERLGDDRRPVGPLRSRRPAPGRRRSAPAPGYRAGHAVVCGDSGAGQSPAGGDHVIGQSAGAHHQRAPRPAPAGGRATAPARSKALGSTRA